MSDKANSKTKDIIVFVAIFIFGGLSIYNFLNLKQARQYNSASAQAPLQTSDLGQGDNQVADSGSSKRTTYVNDNQGSSNSVQTTEPSQDKSAIEELEAFEQTQFLETVTEIKQQRSSILERISQSD